MLFVGMLNVVEPLLLLLHWAIIDSHISILVQVSARPAAVAELL
jgi:hypothetical protein